MINSVNLTSKSDIIGVMASSLCFIHCVATPLLFMAHASAVAIEASHPWWWGILDIVFLAISFFAVYWSAKNTSKRGIRFWLWSSWFVLAFIVFNEKISVSPLHEVTIYFPTMALVFLHIYNRRYFSCNDERCCANKEDR